MDLELPEELRMLKKTVADFVDRELIPIERTTMDGAVFGPDIRPVLFTLNDAQKEKYLFPVLRGEKVTAFAQSEPDAGSDPGAMRTTAVRQGDHYVINGYKRWITKANDAD